VRAYLEVPVRYVLALSLIAIHALPAAAQKSGTIVPATPRQTSSTRLREVVVTFDDLPFVASRPIGIDEQERLTKSLVDMIGRYRIPAVGFVNEDKLQVQGNVDPRRVDLLRQWTKAGLELGNHTYAHLDLHQVSAEKYRDDILRGEKTIRELMAETKRKPRYFRHPFLHTGRDTVIRHDIQSFLEDHGYRVAPVTIDNYDYVFAKAYDRAIVAKDEAQQQRIRAEYLDYMDRVLVYYEKQSIALMGRNIPHVLLLHANTLNAHTFELLVNAYKKRGYSFMALSQALQDQAYTLPDSYAGDAGITWLHRWALTQGRGGALFAGEPEVPKWIERAAN
jgi:peptidoglycan/xylan/chitin deacetylase (PgdA/CDA1 family)